MELRVVKNTKYALAVEIAEYYHDPLLRQRMLAYMSEKSHMWVGERSVRDEFERAKKEGWGVGLLIWTLNKIRKTII